MGFDNSQHGSDNCCISANLFGFEENQEVSMSGITDATNWLIVSLIGGVLAVVFAYIYFAARKK